MTAIEKLGACDPSQSFSPMKPQKVEFVWAIILFVILIAKSKLRMTMRTRMR